MKALLQRVSRASVSVDGHYIASINNGLLVFLGVEHPDTVQSAQKLAERTCQYRLFNDGANRMNLSLADIQGDILVVSQFTLAADTQRGRRPSFTAAAEPLQAENLYERFVQHCQPFASSVKTGQFGADMQVELINDGPVTFLLDVE